MADSLERGQYLAGDSFSNAECAVVPYILRLELLKLVVGGLSRNRRLVGAHARASLGQGGDLRSHDREGLGAVYEPRARPLAQGAGAFATDGVKAGGERRSCRMGKAKRAHHLFSAEVRVGNGEAPLPTLRKQNCSWYRQRHDSVPPRYHLGGTP